ncbi:MAG: hypothetical protein U0002_16935 [Thermoanaerobaculia bacterium]
MDRITHRDIAELSTERQGQHLSMFFPHSASGNDAQAGPIRLKNLLRDAHHQLVEGGLSAEAADEMLTPIARMLQEPKLWRTPGRSFALFLAPGYFRRLRLALGLEEHLMVGPQFAVRPLLPLVLEYGPAYVLALSINEVRVLEANRAGTRRLEVPGLPQSMKEALGYTEFYSELQQHTSAPASQGRSRGGVVHGHGDRDEERFRVDLANYFRRVLRALKGVANNGAPLVLACVESYAPIVREVASGLNVLSEIVRGNPELASDDELGSRAWQLVEAEREREVLGELDRYRELGGTHRAAGDLGQILPAAAAGRVEVLFVHKNAERWGRFEHQEERVEIHLAHRPGDEELLEDAVWLTLETGGRVHVLDGQTMPEGRSAAAILRY